MTIDYNTLTSEQLEEHVELIDWSLVPSKMITEEIKKSFGSMPQLRVRLWLDDLLSKMVMKVDQERYPHHTFLFIGERIYIDLFLGQGRSWCSYEEIWFPIRKTLKFEYAEIEFFIKNVVEIHLKKTYQKMNPFSQIEFAVGNESSYFKTVERYFRNKEEQK